MDSKIELIDCLKNCRVCLINECEMSSLFGAENNPPYNILLMELANVSVDENDGLPPVMCKNCVNEMLQARKFIDKCQETDKNFRSILCSIEIKEVKEINETKDGKPIIKYEPDACTDYYYLDEFKQEVSESNDIVNDSKDETNKQTVNKIKRIRNRRVKTYKESKTTGDYPKKCTECEFILKNESNKRRHILKHTNEKPYQCTECGECYKSLNGLMHHTTIRHIPQDERPTPPKTFPCSTCNKTFFTMTDLKLHTRTHTGEKPYRCELCSRAFTQSQTLRRHGRVHSKERPYKCPLCHKRFKGMYDIKIHLKGKHSEERNYLCSLCNMYFKSQFTLKSHNINIHTCIKNFVCDKCGMAFVSKGSLAEHWKRKHSDRAGECCICNKKYNRLDIHMQHHSKETPFKCSFCNKKFKAESSLRNHMIHHKESGKYACDEDGCTKKFHKPSMLSYHILKDHKKQTPYKCKHCDEGFFRVSDIKRHLKLHHFDKPGIEEDIKDAHL